MSYFKVAPVYCVMFFDCLLTLGNFSKPENSTGNTDVTLSNNTTTVIESENSKFNSLCGCIF